MRWRVPSLVALVIFLGVPVHAGNEPQSVCLPGGNVVVIDAAAHRLSLCQEGRLARTFTVSLGRGGVGKRQEGDLRTPLGAYALGAPRPSEEYVLFIPVGYPTPEQRQAGYTGGDIGIHGPKRKLAWLGRLMNLTDWTRGCIALNREQDIRDIAAWVNLNHPSRVDILPHSPNS